MSEAVVAVGTEISDPALKLMATDLEGLKKAITGLVEADKKAAETKEKNVLMARIEKAENELKETKENQASCAKKAEEDKKEAEHVAEAKEEDNACKKADKKAKH